MKKLEVTMEWKDSYIYSEVESSVPAGPLWPLLAHEVGKIFHFIFGTIGAFRDKVGTCLSAKMTNQMTS